MILIGDADKPISWKVAVIIKFPQAAEYYGETA